jgi:hypothetical protein
MTISDRIDSALAAIKAAFSHSDDKLKQALIDLAKAQDDKKLAEDNLATATASAPAVEASVANLEAFVTSLGA